MEVTFKSALKTGTGGGHLRFINRGRFSIRFQARKYCGASRELNLSSVPSRTYFLVITFMIFASEVHLGMRVRVSVWIRVRVRVRAEG